MAVQLIVAHQTAESPELINHVREVIAADPEAEFVLLVPATPARELRTGETGRGQAIAGIRGGSAAALLRAAGVRVRRVAVGDRDPVTAAGAEVEAHPGEYAGVVVVTLPPGFSRWLRRDLPHQVESRVGLPVTHVVAHSAGGEPRPAGEEHPLSKSAAIQEFLQETQWR